MAPSPLLALPSNFTVDASVISPDRRTWAIGNELVCGTEAQASFGTLLLPMKLQPKAADGIDAAIELIATSAIPIPWSLLLA